VATFCVDAAGYLNNSDGSLNNRGSNGNYWSSTQNDATNGWNLNFNSGNSNMNNNNKANGFSVRCVRDSAFTMPSSIVGEGFFNSKIWRYTSNSRYLKSHTIS
jgi:hypothetical protein